MIRVVGVNFFILLVLLFIFELSFGGWLHDTSSIKNVLHIIKDKKYSFTVDELYDNNGLPITYSRDRYGLRNNSSWNNDIDILVIGGSTTDQRYIDDSKTWDSVLENNFRSEKRNVNVVNAGVDGQSSYGHIKNFEYWFPFIAGFKTKYILYFVGINDIYKDDDNLYDRLDYAGKRTHYRDIEIIIKEKSILYYLYRTFAGIQKAQKAGILHGKDKDVTYKWVNQPLLEKSEHATITSTRIDGFEKRLTILANKTRELGATPIFVTQKLGFNKIENGVVTGVDTKVHYDGHMVNYVDLYYINNLFNKTTMDVCARNQGICIDLAAELNLDAEADYYDAVHNTPQGALKIGSYLYQKLRERINR